MALTRAEKKFVEQAIDHGTDSDTVILAIWMCRSNRVEPDFDVFKDIAVDVNDIWMEEEG